LLRRGNTARREAAEKTSRKFDASARPAAHADDGRQMFAAQLTTPHLPSDFAPANERARKMRFFRTRGSKTVAVVLLRDA